MNVGGIKATFHHRSPSDPMGRFGGGWQWKLGLQAGGRSLIVNLLVCYVKVTLPK